MFNRLNIATVITMTLSLLTQSAMAMPLLTISPADYTYHNPAAGLGSTLTIPYTITNHTPATLSHITASKLPTGITSTICDTIAPGGQCTLNLTIPATLTSQPGVIHGQFQVCVNDSTSGCTSVDTANQLDITILNQHSYLAITDMHVKDGYAPPITYGQDTGDALWASTLNEITTLINTEDPKFIVMLGDLPAHHDDAHLQQNIGAVLTSLSNLPAISDRQLPVFYVFGNNDSLVVDYGPFYNGTTNLFSLDPAHHTPATKGWPALNANPDCSLSPNQACTYTTTSPMPAQHANDMAYAETRGFYSAYPLGSAVPLRFISVNSVIFSFEYSLTGATQLAAAQEEMDWLAEQLADAAANGEAVYIAMHIPVGTDAFNHGDDMWNNTLILSNGKTFGDNFLALMEQYKANVRTVMSAHTHLDELRALYPNQALADMSVLDVGIPGITPQHYNNPGMQIYLYNNAYQLTEAKTFFTTPAPGNWTTYSFQHDYHCPANSTLLTCVTSNIILYLPAWKLATQPIPGNPYETDYSVRVPTYSPSPYSNWLLILNAIQVAPAI